MKRLCIIFLLLLCLTGKSQTQQPWEKLWQEMNSPEDMEEEQWQEDYELMQQLAEHPIDLNNTSREELEQLPFLSDQQVMDIVEYLDRYGPVRSHNELKMIRSMDYWQLALMRHFTVVGDVAHKEQRFPRLKTITKYGKHKLTATARIPFYERKGDKNGYLGYKYRHSLRYEFSYSKFLKAVIIGAQDAGEPFLSKNNELGYDTYSYYIQVKKLGIIENAVLGKYKVSMGMGLVLNSSFSLGKMATLQNKGKIANSLRAHSSRSEADYFQGAAATIRLARPLQLTLLASYRPIDATLNADNTAATLITSGYHRTPTEMGKKHNTHQGAVGAELSYHSNGVKIGLHGIYTETDRRLNPSTKTDYRKYYPRGNHFMNAGIDYTLMRHNIMVGGETAINKDGALATVNMVSVMPWSEFCILAIQRFYSYRYNGLYAHGFGNTTRTQNESGIYLGLSWVPIRDLRIQGYADYAYSPWARYQISKPSHEWDFLLQSDYVMGKWTVQGRQRIRLRQKDNSNKTALIANDEKRTRLSATYTSEKGWTSTTQGDYCVATYKENSQGWMVSQHLAYQTEKWKSSLAAGYFNTNNYSSRIYVYERQLQHDFSFPSFYGEGFRLSLFAQADIIKNLRISLKLDHTKYFDRHTIGTGLQQINQSYYTDLNLQLQWKF